MTDGLGTVHTEVTHLHVVLRHHFGGQRQSNHLFQAVRCAPNIPGGQDQRVPALRQVGLELKQCHLGYGPDLEPGFRELVRSFLALDLLPSDSKHPVRVHRIVESLGGPVDHIQLSFGEVSSRALELEICALQVELERIGTQNRLLETQPELGLEIPAFVCPIRLLTENRLPGLLQIRSKCEGCVRQHDRLSDPQSASPQQRTHRIVRRQLVRQPYRLHLLGKVRRLEIDIHARTCAPLGHTLVLLRPHQIKPGDLGLIAPLERQFDGCLQRQLDRRRTRPTRGAEDTQDSYHDCH